MSSINDTLIPEMSDAIQFVHRNVLSLPVVARKPEGRHFLTNPSSEDR